LNYLNQTEKFNQSANWIKFKQALTKEILDTIKVDSVLETYTKEISNVIEFRLKQKDSYIVTSESNHINLIANLISSDLRYQPTLEFLFYFLQNNSNIFNLSLTDPSRWADLDFTFLQPVSDLSKFDLLDELQSIKHFDLTLISSAKWMSLLNQVKLRLSFLSISTLLGNRKDFLESEEDYIKKVKSYYAIK